MPENPRAPQIAEPLPLKILLMAIAVAFVALFLLAPLAMVFLGAFSQGYQVYLTALADPVTLAAIKLTLLAALISVCCNTIFGLAAAWCIAKFHFRGKALLTSLIELPLAVSPVIAGLVFVLLFGHGGLLSGLLELLHLKIIFAVPGIVLATTFVTLPFVARELIPLMEAQGSDEEHAALTLGAGGFQTFRLITLPAVKWALFYGIILCNARAMGEFGAVSVVSGHIRGVTTTLPLQVEILYNEYNYAAAFAVASLLTLVAIATILIKRLLSRRLGDHLP